MGILSIPAALPKHIEFAHKSYPVTELQDA